MYSNKHTRNKTWEISNMLKLANEMQTELKPFRNALLWRHAQDRDINGSSQQYPGAQWVDPIPTP
jgi:hypothetical protein